MKILTDPIESFTFENIVDFCATQEREGIQLDYKSDLTTGSLSKHFASFSNTLGGVIIIGVEENKKTGLPIKNEGITTDRKNIERITQWANNVNPLPNYKIHQTNEVNGRVFILIRTYEGTDTPYYVQNDGRIFVRTNDITKELTDIASADYAKLLQGKQEKANESREYFDERSQIIRNNLFIRAEESESKETKMVFRPETRFLNAKSICGFKIQPHYPSDQLTEPSNLMNKVRDYQIRTGSYEDFPSSSELIAIPEGVAYFVHETKLATSYHYQAIFSQGFLIDEFSINGRNIDKDIYLDYLAGKLFIFLLSAQKFYSLFNYQGTLNFSFYLERIRNITLVNYTNATFTKKINALKDNYEFAWNLDTNEISKNDTLTEAVLTFFKKIYWDLGFEEYNKDILIQSFKDTRIIS